METKLNYKVNVPNQQPTEDVNENKDFSSKSRTKLSMQATVNGALGSKLPSGPAQAQMAANPNGWGRNQ